uniref:Uncharacterized protein n=1 Tax=Avena sativa TaxID=4498 RepID=A0ACD5WF69_AVESA
MAGFAAGSCRWISTTAYIFSLIALVLVYIVFQVVILVFAVDMFDFDFNGCRAAVCRLLMCADLSEGENKQVMAPPDTQPALPDAQPAGNNATEQQVEDLEEGIATPGTNHRNNGPGECKKATAPDTPLESGDNDIAIIPPPSSGNNHKQKANVMMFGKNGQAVVDNIEQSRSLLLLLATLAATVTYQAGLSPPDMPPRRYKAFYYCNTSAFVASVVVIVIIQSKHLSSGAAVRRAALNTVMILDLFCLMGAYVAGSCRDTTSTIYVFTLAIAVFVYSMAKVVADTAYGQSKLIQWVQVVGKNLARALLRLPQDDDQQVSDPDLRVERKRKFLLQLAILAATITYQTGLNPPGGFWQESNEEKGITKGDPVLLVYYRTRYQVFFYCNATGFMASVAIILLLVNQTLYKQSIRSSALHVCMLVGLLGLMGAYAAGSCRKLRTSIYVFALVATVVTFLVLQILLYMSAGHSSKVTWLLPRILSTAPAGVSEPSGENKTKEIVSSEQQHMINKYTRRKYLMLLSILGASVTYQAGLAPPGGTWGDDEDDTSPSVVASNPILLDSNGPRYRAFFYCNATSFVASVVVIMLLLQRTVKKKKKPTVQPIEKKRPGALMWAMQTVVVLDLLGLLGAYAAGSCRDWETSAYVMALVAVVVLFITLHVLLSFDTVLNKSKKLKVWQYFQGGNDNQASRNGVNA